MKWMKEKEEQMISLIKNGNSYEEISIIINTTPGAIRSKCFNIGIKSSDYKKTKKIVCLNCNDEFVPKKNYQKFCSLRCSSTHNNKKRKEITNCLICGNELKSYQKKCCSVNCNIEYNYGEFIKRWKDGKENGMRGDGISLTIRKYLFKKYDNKCCKCDWGEINPTTNKIPLQVEHIDGDYKNNKENNLLLLCPNCHSLTPTFGSLNSGKGRNERQRYRNQLKELSIDELISKKNKIARFDVTPQF